MGRGERRVGASRESASGPVSPAPCPIKDGRRAGGATPRVARPQAPMASAEGDDGPRCAPGRRALSSACPSSSQHGSRPTSEHARTSSWSSGCAVEAFDRVVGAAAPSIVQASRTPPAPSIQPDLGARTSRRTSAHGRDDVAAVGLELVLLVAVHEVEVELVDAGRGELAQLGDVLVDRAEDAEPVGDLVADEGRVGRADLGVVVVVVARRGPGRSR